ncbi:MAG: hypothetical protein K8I60_03995 [Anaerolineae bacterium]|nr:hypothetical protein [Anaerolineae bacterium]
MIDPEKKDKEKEAQELSDDDLDKVSGGSLNPEQSGQGSYTPPPPKKP